MTLSKKLGAFSAFLGALGISGASLAEMPVPIAVSLIAGATAAIVVYVWRQSIVDVAEIHAKTQVKILERKAAA